MNYPTNEASGEWTAAEAGLIDQARALAPVLRERAAMAEETLGIRPATHAVFRAADFYRWLRPPRYGGLEARYGLRSRRPAEIAPRCAYTAWALSVTACHAWI